MTLLFRAILAGTTLAMAPHTGHGIKCSLSKLQDTERTGIVAYTYLLPEGWKSSNQLKWQGQLPLIELSAQTADGEYMVDRFDPSNLNFSAGSNLQPSGVHLGGALDYLHVLVDGMQRQGIATNVQVIDEATKALPLTQMQQSRQSIPFPHTTSEPFHETGFMKITFERNGNQETASLGTSIVGSNNVMKSQMPYGNQVFERDSGYYTVGPTILVISPTESSPVKVKEAQLIASSMRITPDWIMYCAKSALQMAQNGLERTREAGQAQIAQFQRDSANRMANFRTQMADKDENTHQFCNYLLDQQDYKDPAGGTVTLPSTYKYAWGNGQGNYWVTDDPTFDPKGTGAVNGTWQVMQKAQPGH